MAATLMVLAGILVFTMSRLAAAGRPLHHEFANRAAAVDGEMFDVIGNIPLVWSFCGVGREHSRLDATIDREMAARRRSLYYLEKLRLFHAAITVVLTKRSWPGPLRFGRTAPPPPATSSWYARLAFPFCTPHGTWLWRSWTSPNIWRGFQRHSEHCLCRIICAIIHRPRRWRDRAQP
jgi:hypothetical protein